MFSFITKRGIGFNLFIASAIGIALLLIAFYSLRYFTAHNVEMKVPNVVGMQTDEAKKH